MSEVPKFVRQRLQQQAAGEHPDANVLTAFAEDALSGRERAQVLAHLSACAACREVVSLALPEVPAAAPAAAPSGARWSRWPMLRWAGVAAAVVVVAAAVVVQNSRRAESVPKVASVSESAQKPAESKRVETPAAGAQPAEAVSDRAEKERRTDRDSGRAKAESRADRKKDASVGMMASAVPAHADRVAQGNVPVQSQVQNQMLALSAARAAQAPSGKAAAPVAGIVAMDQSKQQAPQPAPQAASAKESVEVTAQYDAATTRKAKSEVQEQEALNRRAGARPTAAATSADATGSPIMKSALRAALHWRVSTEGALERSTDAGRTWQFVRVGAAATTFRSFSSVGRDLWAGGTGGALYHSPDNGHTWQRVTVKSGAAILESDITRVEFTDAQHGTVTTTTGETWATADGGATWSVRR